MIIFIIKGIIARFQHLCKYSVTKISDFHILSDQILYILIFLFLMFLYFTCKIDS